MICSTFFPLCRLLVNSRTRSRSFFVAFGLGHRCMKCQRGFRWIRFARSGILRWSCRTLSLGILAVSGMPSHLPPPKHDQSKAPSLQRVVLHAFIGTVDLSDSLPTPHAFCRPALYARSLPDSAVR